jgi:RND family efflux transporter MFP subunit
MMNKFYFVLLAAVLILAPSCKKKNKYANLADKPLPVEVEVVGESSKLEEDIHLGEIRPKVDIDLVFPLGGELTGVFVSSGDHVRKGDVIATVDDTQAKSLLESANAILRQAEDGYNRLKPVHEQGGISDVKWVEMETNLEKARSMAISSQKRYEDCTIRAVQDGIVNMKTVDKGQQLMPGQSIGTLMDLSSYVIFFNVPESEIGKISIGDTIIVSLPALENTYKAIIAEKSIMASRLAHTYRVKADIISPEAVKNILPGMISRAIIRNRKSHGFIIGAGCVQTQQRGHSVWKIRNKKAYKQIIKITDYVENGVMVSEGLQLGDSVVSKGYQKLYEGANVICN